MNKTQSDMEMDKKLKNMFLKTDLNIKLKDFLSNYEM